mmetsp:Transcript_5146/g.7743  ORF Transcript_5146/g.7743 Transcript_5146/m.7743 type:complete len:138 (-) Transcript_5146:192-605(-)
MMSRKDNVIQIPENPPSVKSSHDILKKASLFRRHTDKQRTHPEKVERSFHSSSPNRANRLKPNSNPTQRNSINFPSNVPSKEHKARSGSIDIKRTIGTKQLVQMNKPKDKSSQPNSKMENLASCIRISSMNMRMQNY